jgi:hypothetical protein
VSLADALREGWWFAYRLDDERVVVERRRADGLLEKALAFDTAFDPWAVPIAADPLAW